MSYCNNHFCYTHYDLSAGMSLTKTPSVYLSVELHVNAGSDFLLKKNYFKLFLITFHVVKISSVFQIHPVINKDERPSGQPKVSYFNVLSPTEGNSRNKERLRTDRHTPSRYILLNALEMENIWNSFFPASWACQACSICEGRRSASLHSLKRCHSQIRHSSVFCKECPQMQIIS